MMRRMGILLLGVAAAGWWHGARADTFGAGRYDPTRDELVVTMLYRGTNPDHTFTLNWGKCGRLPDGQWQIAIDVLDSQPLDPERRDYKKTIHISLAQLQCRPVELSLRTAPRFYYTLRIPAAPTPAPAP
jgi:hypothetical protein